MIAAVTGVSAIDIQNAPTGRNSVIATVSAGSSPTKTISIPDQGPAPPAAPMPMRAVISAASPTSACGVRAARARIRSDSRRVSVPSVRMGGSGR